MGVFCLIWRFTTTLQSQCLQAYFYICVRSTFTGLQLKYFIWINPALPQFMTNINLEPDFLNERKFSDYERKFYSWDHCSENNRLLLIIFNFKRWRSTFNSKYNLTVKKCWICQYSSAHIPLVWYQYPWDCETKYNPACSMHGGRMLMKLEVLA